MTSRGSGVPHYYVCEVAAGQPVDFHLGSRPDDSWTHVAVELGSEVVRFLSSPDGRDWTPLLFRVRPESWRGGPPLLLAGRGYGREDSKKPNFTHHDDGAPVETASVAGFREIAVERIAANRLGLSTEERSELSRPVPDELGEKELSAHDDPSFNSVAKHLPAMKNPREVVGVKDHPNEIGVEWDGSLQLTDNIYSAGPVAFFEAGSPPARFGSEALRCSKRLLGGSLPVVVAKASHDGVGYEQTVFGYSDAFSPDGELWAYVRLETANLRDVTRQADLNFRVEPTTITVDF